MVRLLYVRCVPVWVKVGEDGAIASLPTPGEDLGLLEGELDDLRARVTAARPGDPAPPVPTDNG